MTAVDLNLPILSQLQSCKNLLITGMGGGFDIFCGLPIYFELCQSGTSLHLANFSFSDVQAMRGGTRLSPTLVGVRADQPHIAAYFPELHLSRWFAEHYNQDVTIWSFASTGAGPLLENYRRLVEHLSIDGILLIDGGVDSLVRGNEADMGTYVEDATSLFVINELAHVPTRLMGCVGMGAERDLSYGHILENIAALAQTGGFLGACALTPQMESYQSYEAAVHYVQGQRLQDSSVINSSIISAVRGHFGDYHLTEKTKGSSLRISPLMSVYWFFDLVQVARNNLYLSSLRGTETFGDAFFSSQQMLRYIPRRPGGQVQL